MKWHDQLNWYSAIGIHVEPWLVGHKADRRGITVRGAMDAVIKPVPFGSILPQSGPPELGGWIVSPLGGTGAGTFADPWSLSYALSGGGGRVLPGHTVWLRGGTYAGAFNSLLAGTTLLPIVVRQYPRERATIDGNLVVHGTQTWFWGFELMSSVSAPADLTGIAMDGIGGGTGIKCINMPIHDSGGNGIGNQDPTASTEIYGCLIYRNGRQRVTGGFAHGIYFQSESGTKIMSDNFLFDNLGYDFHGYAESGQVNHYRVLFNIGINTGISGVGHWLLGRSGIAQGMVDGLVNGNMLYGTQVASIVVTGPIAGNSGIDLTFTNNYIWGATNEFRRWQNLVVTGNTFASVSQGTRLYVPGAGYPTSPTYVLNNNNYFASTSQGFVPQFESWLNEVAQPLRAFAAWKAATGYEAASTLVSSVSGKPTVNVVFIRPNAYEPKRANIAIYNWQLLGSVAVDVSSVLSVGDVYEVRNVQDYFGTPVLSGIYAGGTIPIPMTAITPQMPVGGWPGSAPPATGPEFNAFVLKLQNV